MDDEKCDAYIADNANGRRLKAALVVKGRPKKSLLKWKIVAESCNGDKQIALLDSCRYYTKSGRHHSGNFHNKHRPYYW